MDTWNEEGQLRRIQVTYIWLSLCEVAVLLQLRKGFCRIYNIMSCIMDKQDCKSLKSYSDKALNAGAKSKDFFIFNYDFYRIAFTILHCSCIFTPAPQSMVPSTGFHVHLIMQIYAFINHNVTHFEDVVLPNEPH